MLSRTNKNINMLDVAQLAGVSLATVSRSLAQPQKVSAATRQRIEQAMIRSGYIAQNVIKEPLSHTLTIILILIDDLQRTGLAEKLSGICSTATELGYHPIFSPMENTLSLKQFIALRQPCGILLMGDRLPTDILSLPRLPPIITMAAYRPAFAIASVSIDPLITSYQAVSHLIKIGHQNIALLITTSDNKHYLKQGYQQALNRSNIAIEKHYIQSVSDNFIGGIQGVSALMSLPQPPEAIVCSSDHIAIGALHQAKRLKINVPKRLSIIGFDNISLAQYSEPPLTTVDRAHYQVGKKVVNLLNEHLQGRVIQRGSHLIETELIVRHSTAKPSS